MSRIARRTFVLAAAALFAAPLALGERQAGKVYRIGWLEPFPRSEFLREAFLDEFHGLGWIEGRDYVLTRAANSGDPHKIEQAAANLVRRDLDILVTGGTPNIRILKKLTSTTPIVFGVAGDPVESGLVESLARPGGNVTGVTLIADYSMVGKHLELLISATPRAASVAVLANPENSTHIAKMAKLEQARKSLSVKLQRVDAASQEDLERAFRAAREKSADALLVLADSVSFQARKRIAELALQYRLPTMFFLREHVDAGGLMSYAPRLTATFRRAAHQVDKILRGENVAEVPIERPNEFELVINRTTAKALGITLSAQLLLRADQVIE
jgi:putative tryptophan/tyrosine transport system substrate-binding protein